MAHSLFNEQIVKRNLSVKDRLIQVGISLLAPILIALFLCFPQLMTVIPVLVVAVIAAAFFLIRRQNIEFEYAISDGYFEISKIYAKSSRKNIAYIEFSSVEFFAKTDKTKKELKEEYNTVYDCTGNEGDVYGIVYPGEADEGKCMLLFTPNEKMLAALQRSISPRIWKYNA